jgi:YidC/Oxa1 family membrane protein insertase
MLASIPIVSPVFQFLLDSIGWVLAEIYRFIPNYAVAIVILTLIIRFILFPLGMKQIKSMQAMQAIQPKVKEIQKKYKNDKQKAQAETMKLYKETGVNPLGSCLPLLLQFPILISMYAVIRMPLLEAQPNGSTAPTAYVVMNNHLPVDSRLFADVIEHQHTGIGIMNFQCSAAQSGTTAQLEDTSKNQIQDGKPLINGTDLQPIPSLTSSGQLDCGNGIPSKIPYFVLLAAMIATTFYQQRQMQKASPPGASSQQQQAIMKFMPLMFGIFGFAFPGGLVLYWTTSNLFQITQQAMLLRAGHIGPEALDRRIAEQREKAAAKANEPEKPKGFLSRMMEQAQNPQAGKKPTASDPKPKPTSKPKPSGPRRKPNTGPKKRPGSGGSNDS